MQTVILAGGLGTRLRPLTYKIPKTMAPVGGKPYLYYQLRYLKSQNLTDCLILTGYLGEQVSDYFKDGSNLGLSIQYSKEPEPLGTAGALKLAENQLHDAFFLINGDSFLPLNFTSLQSDFKQMDKTGVVCLYKNDRHDTGVKSNIAVNVRMEITDYNKIDPREDMRYIDAGIIAFKKQVLETIPTGQKISLENDIYPQLIQSKQFNAHITEQRFFDIGCPQRLKEFEAYARCREDI